MPHHLKGNLIVCQSGGPTAVINSSLVGVIDEALRHKNIKEIYGAVNGILGILNLSIIDLRKEKRSTIIRLRNTPSSALGSSRYKIKEEDLDKILETFKRLNIRYFFVNGGNDSMDTGNRVMRFAEKNGFELRVIGIPKTVDNDLMNTDHCPGYGSIGRWLAIATMDAGRDTEGIYTADPIKIIETMGRDTGWVGATTSLAKQQEEDAPHLIYLPESPFSIEKFLKDVQTIYRILGYAVIVVSEGLRGKDGKPIAESKRPIDTDSFGHRQPGGIGQYLVDVVVENLGLKARFDKPGTIQRSSILCASKTDLKEAYQVGKMAVRYAIEGKSGFMVTLERKNSSYYQMGTGWVELEKVANQIRPFPRKFINGNHNFVTSEFLKYFTPLIGGDLPRYVRLKKYAIKRPK
jgi:6-phosphofructokinase